MDNPDVMAKRKERIQTIIVLSPFVFLLIWNAVFFYTDWWETYLKPIGLHTWLDSLHWLRPIYDGLETRIYQHDVDAQKYMVLLSWGVLWAIVLGLFLLIMFIKWMAFGNHQHFAKANIKADTSTYAALFISLMLLAISPYVFTKNYGEFTTSYLGKFMATPSFLSLTVLQFIYLFATLMVPIVTFLIVYLLISDCKKALKKSMGSDSIF